MVRLGCPGYYCNVALFSYFGITEIDNVLAVGLHAVILFARAYHNTIPLTQTSACRDEMSADDVLLHALKEVLLAADGSLIEHLGSLLERCSRHERLRLQCCTGDTLQNLGRRGRHGIAHLYGTKVAALQ